MASIIFQEDWAKYPEAIPDVQTSNESFLRYSALLRDMGIKNHKFPLALHNRNLVGVDPFDPNLQPAQMLAIGKECYVNFWYFVREIVRIPGGTINVPITYNANRANTAMFWLYFNHIFNIQIQPRQTGKSFGFDEISSWLMNIRKRKAFINMLTKDDKLRQINLTRLKTIMNELPFYLRQLKPSDVANTEKIRINSRETEYNGFVPNKSEKGAQGVARGHTADTFQIDEAPYVANIHITLPAMLSAGGAARQMAADKGEPYGTCITTTVGDLMDEEGLYVFNLCQNSAEFSERLYDCANLEELRLFVRKQNKSNTDGRPAPIRVLSEFNHRQLGKTDAWLIAQMEEAAAEGEDGAKDYLNKWKFGESSSALTKEEKETVSASITDPIWVETCKPYGYMMRWYLSETETRYAVDREMIIGLDTSDASGGDDIGIVGTCPYSGETLFAMDVNETSIGAFAQWQYGFLKKYSRTVIIPERRSTGSAICDLLIDMFLTDGVNPFRRIFNLVVQQHKEREQAYRLASKPYGVDADVVYSNKKTFGFATSAVGITSRTELYSTTMRHCIKYTGAFFKDKKLSNQIMALIKDKHSRVDHRVGQHDDLVIGKLLSHWLITSGKNLEFYGLDYSRILKNNFMAKQENDPKTVMQRNIDNSVINKVNSLLELLSKERDPYLKLRIEHELKLFYARLPTEAKTATTYDEMIKNIRDDRKMSNYTRRL